MLFAYLYTATVIGTFVFLAAAAISYYFSQKKPGDPEQTFIYYLTGIGAIPTASFAIAGLIGQNPNPSQVEFVGMAFTWVLAWATMGWCFAKAGIGVEAAWTNAKESKEPAPTA